MTVFYNRFDRPYKTRKLDSHGKPIFAFDWFIRDTHELDFAELAELTQSIVQECATKNDAPMWSFTRPVPDAPRELTRTGERLIKRNNPAAFDVVSVLPLDYDTTDYSIDEFVADFGDYEFILHTSFSAYQASKKGAECFRVLMRVVDDGIPISLLEEPVAGRPSIRPAIVSTFPKIDQSCFEVTRGFFCPSCPKGSLERFRFLHNKGKPFDWRALPQTVLPKREQVKREVLPTEAAASADGFELKTFDIYRWFQQNTRFHQLSHKKIEVECPDGLAHSDGNTSAHIWLNSEDRWQFKCMHNHGGQKCGTTWARNLLFEQHGDKLAPYCQPIRKKETTSGMWQRRLQQLATTPQAKPTGQALVFDEQDNLITLADRYLDPMLLKQIPETGATFIQSPKGTGKTVLIRDFVSELKAADEPVLLIGHRINLMRALTAKGNLDLDFYLDFEDGEINSKHLGISLDSLPRLPELRTYANTTVIIDECEQVFQHLLSDTLKAKGRRSAVLTVLFRILRTCKRVVLLDADLTAELSIEVLKLCRGQIKLEAEPLLAIQNDYIFEGRTTQLYESQQHLVADLVECANKPDSRIFVSTNYLSFGKQLVAVLAPLGKQILLVSSETAELPEVQEFLADPSEASKDYEIIIATPTAQTGISIDNFHFTDVYGFYGWRVGTFQDIDQGCSRVRRVDLHKVWVQEADQKPPSRTWQSYRDELLAKEQATRVRCFGEDDGLGFATGERLWAEIHARVRWLVECWEANKAEQFVELRLARGYNMEPVVKDEAMHNKGKQALDLAEAIQEEHHAKALWEVEDIEPELHELLSRKRRSKEEQLLVERYRLREALGAQWSYENLVKAIDQQLLKLKFELEKLVKWSLDEQLDFDRRSREKHTVAINDASHVVMTTAVYNELCAAMGIKLADLVNLAKSSLDAGQDTEITQQMMLDLAKWATSNRRTISRYVRFRIKNPVEEPKATWQAVLGHILPLRAVKKQIDGVRQQRYFIDANKRDIVLRTFDLDK